MFLELFNKAREDLPEIEHVIVVDGDGGDHTLEEVEEMDPDFDPGPIVDELEPDDMLTLIYTSGTTGPPKGVQLTHRNLMGLVGGVDEMLDLPERGAKIISWLPAAHIAERGAHYYLPVIKGVSVTICPDPRKIGDSLAAVRPTWFFAVPRIFEKLKAGIEASFAKLPDEQRVPAQKGLEAAIQKVRLEQSGQEVPEELAAGVAQAEEAMFKPLRQKMGLDELVACNVGAAPTPVEVLEFFHAIGIPIGELWGMSETCGVATCNPPSEIKIGTVGPPVPGVEIRLAEDGEVQVKASSVMPGYRNMPEKTAETFDEDGWLLTGDIGELDEDGYLKIVDRKKELIINAAGKNMSPANIESHLKSASPLIGQAAAIGDQRPFNVALIVLDPDYAPVWAKQNGLEGKSVEELASEDATLQAIAGRGRGGQREDGPRRADQEVQDPADRVGAGRRRADADDEAEAQADRREVREGDRGAVQEVAAVAGPPEAFRDAINPSGRGRTIERMFEATAPADLSPSDPSSAPGPSGSTEPLDTEIPLEHLEHEIVQLASHINAGTCRWLELVAEFDRREGWGSWRCRSCSEWIAWRCALDTRSAREHVRVARSLGRVPLIHAAFARGELSYSKVRALTRVADADSEAELLEFAEHATAAQLERIVRGLRRMSTEDANGGHERRYLSAWWEPDGSLSISGNLAAEGGAAFLAALDAMHDLIRATRSPDDAGSREENGPAGPASEADTCGSAEPHEPRAATNADALVAMAEAAVAGPGAGTHPPPELVVHVDVATLTADAPGTARLEHGSALAPETIRRLACDCSIVPLIEDADGSALSVGRRTRSVPPAIARALRARDGTCAFPGCENRRFLDAHHILHWARGGETSAENLVRLCRRHHRAVHEGGYSVERNGGGGVNFSDRFGHPVQCAPHSPPGDPRALARAAHARGASAGTLQPGDGERLDLDLTLHILGSRPHRRPRDSAGTTEGSRAA